jgi:uncharacterized OB-fold protein
MAGEASSRVARICASSKEIREFVTGRGDVDVEASAERYEALCREALREPYPGAVVEFTLAAGTSVELEEGSAANAVEIAADVERICRAIDEEGEWIVGLDESGGVGG